MERATLVPIGRALELRGHTITYEEDFTAASEVGVYACHGNRFFDFALGQWRQLPSTFSVMCLHDFGQAGEVGVQYFVHDGWDRFNLGLLPGPSWHELWDRAVRTGIPGPSHGMRVVGWPKADSAFALEADPSVRSSVRRDLGLADLPTLLLACSWSDRRQLDELLVSVDRHEFNVVVKYPESAPPPGDSPWFNLLNDAYEELQAAIDTAAATPDVVVADPATDLYRLLAAMDLVVSNGSNVLYEAVLMGIPGVSVDTWLHPGGIDGRQRVPPRIELDGVVSGGIESLELMIRTAIAADHKVALARGANRLVAVETRGRASILAAAAIEECAATFQREGC
jgi:hypothetical protein